MEKSNLKSVEWWTSVAVNLLTNPARVALDFAKLISKPEGKEALEHTKSILESLHNDPLPIDRDDPNLTLLKIYVTPSAKYRSDKAQNKDDEQTTIRVPNLIESLLETIEKSSSPIIIHGQPGHGKTSSVRMLTQAIVAAEQEKSKSERSIVLMYEFKNLGRLDSNEIQILSQRTPFVREESFFHGKNTVLILDGLDERQITNGSDHALQTFIRNMFALSDRINKQKNSRLNLILTGRSQFVKGIQSAFTSAYHLFEIQDFSQEQVERWLDKYCTIKKIDPPITYQNFIDKHLNDLIHQPILLTISAMMLADKDGQKLIRNLQGTISRGDIYRIIITWTYNRKLQYHSMPDEVSYRQLLRILAFILFRHGEEKIKISSLIDALKQDNKLYDLEIIKNKGDENIENTCRNLAVSFFFRGLEENAFSFIHKSVKDYLITEAIFELLKEATENFKPKKIEKSCDDMAADIYFILGKSGLSPEDHIPFLIDIIANQKEVAKKMFKPLEAFFKSAQEHIYLIKNENVQNANPLKTEANVLSGLLYMLTNIFHSLSEDERKEFYADGYLKVFQNGEDFSKYLSILDSVYYYGSQNKYYFDWSLISFFKLDLSFACFRDRCLKNMNLIEISFEGANLMEADLTNANLSYSNLSSALLFEASLKNAILHSTDLSSAFIVAADLTNADLTGADLFNSDVRLANLSGANLMLTNLSVANLQGAIGLTNEQLKDAIIDESTILPDYLKKSEP